MKEVWVVGEALIDLIPDASGSRVAVVGGGPANTAKALAQLRISVSFVGGISIDQYGELIEKELIEAGVDLSKVNRSDLPTAIAKVTLDGSGSASYEFSLENTATFDFDSGWLPRGNPDVIHIGTLATIVEPGASELLKWAKRSSAPIVFDPNVRSSVLDNRDEYRKKIEPWVGISSVVKASAEDIQWLYPDIGYVDVAREWIEKGVALVVITRGADGIVAANSDGVYEVAGVKVDVVDTVGAGDTVGAIVVEGILEVGLERLKNERLIRVLERAAKAASITCSRAGAKPPSRDEL